MTQPDQTDIKERLQRAREGITLCKDPVFLAGVLAGAGMGLAPLAESAARLRGLDEAHAAALPDALAMALYLLRHPEEVECRPGLPSVEQVRQQEKRGGWPESPMTMKAPAEWTDAECLDLYQRAHDRIDGSAFSLSEADKIVVTKEVRAVLTATAERTAAEILRECGYGAPEAFARELRRLAEVPDRIELVRTGRGIDPPRYTVRVNGADWLEVIASVPSVGRDGWNEQEIGRRAEITVRGLRWALEAMS